MAAQSDMRASLAAIIPCYNAGHRVRPVVEQVLGHLEQVLVVDDGSTDGAVEAMADLPVQVVRLAENRGKGHALLAGFREALARPETEAVCVLDADGQHNPEELPRLWAAFREEQADLVIGSRVFTTGNVPFRSRFGNTVTIAATRLLLGHRLPDTQCGYRLLSRRFAEDVVGTVSGGRYETEMEMIVKAVRGEWRVATVPIATIYEAGNPSSHFHKLRDSALIYGRLLGAVMRR
jgi:glycosyltransferase involved in cell wall biosynthesis